MKILIVDDSSTMRRIISNAIKSFVKYDLEIIEAEDGCEGLEKVSNDFDVILSDWNMPNMTGIEFLQKSVEKGITKPFIMVTTEAEKSNVFSAIKSGAKNYLTKPFTPIILKSKIEATLGRDL
jgi:two-component system chemotaxis response regulator CheY